MDIVHLRLRISLLLGCWLLLIRTSSCDFASLSLTTNLPATPNSSQEVISINYTFCAFFNPSYASPPYQSHPRLDGFHHAVYPSENQEKRFGCSSPIPSNVSLQDSILLVDRGSCSFYKKAWLAQKQGASLLVVIYNQTVFDLSPRLVPTDMQNVTTPISIPVLYVLNGSGEQIKNWLSNSTAIYMSAYVTSRPSSKLFDLSSMALCAIAVGTLMMAAFLSNSPFQFLWYGLLLRPDTWHMFVEKDSSSNKPQSVVCVKDSSSSKPQSVVSVKGSSSSKPQSVVSAKDSSSSKPQSVVSAKDSSSNKPQSVVSVKDSSSSKPQPVVSEIVDILVIVSVTCALLLLLYFFHTTMVYIVLALYCVASVFGLYHLVSPFVALISFVNKDKYRVPPNQLPILKYRPNILFFITVAGCVGVVLFWVVQRHSSYAWVLQNILGFAFISRLLYYLEFEKVWVVAIYMILVFFYDVFMVFITPYFTSDGVSVMEKAITGGVGGTSEKLPLVFLVPMLRSSSPLDATCDEYFGMKPSFLLLGYGDVYIPGLLVTLCLKFDRQYHPKNRFKLYYFTSSIAYMVGLICTSLGMALMQTAQPALLYLVPTTLGSVLVVSLLKGEFFLFFFGKRRKSTTHDNTNESHLRQRYYHRNGSHRRRRGRRH